MENDTSATTELRMRLAPDCSVIVAFSGPVTHEAIDLLIELLTVSKRGFPAATVPESTHATNGREE